MGHHCGALNRRANGHCQRWLVNYLHCADHRGSLVDAGRPSEEHASVPAGSTPNLETLLHDVEVPLRSLADDYVGPAHAAKLRRARWRGGNCEPIAAAARALSDLKAGTHDVAAQVTGAALPKKTPPLVRAAVTMVVGRTVGATDALGVTIRALQVMGISYCMLRSLPLTECPCLQMITRETTGEAVREKVGFLIADATEDLKQL